MAITPTKNPRLPVAPLEYNKLFMDQFEQILGLYFNTVDNAVFGILQNQSNLGIISVKDFVFDVIPIPKTDDAADVSGVILGIIPGGILLEIEASLSEITCLFL